MTVVNCLVLDHRVCGMQPSFVFMTEKVRKTSATYSISHSDVRGQKDCGWSIREGNYHTVIEHNTVHYIELQSFVIQFNATVQSYGIIQYVFFKSDLGLTVLLEPIHSSSEQNHVANN